MDLRTGRQTLETHLRRGLKRVLFGSSAKPIRLLGAELVAHASEEHTYVRAAKLQSRHRVFRHELPVLMYMAALLRPGTTFVDCGANIGLWSLALAHAARPLDDVQIMAFEPIPTTFHRLSQATAAWPNIHVFNLALASSATTLLLAEGVGSGTFGVAAQAPQSGLRHREVQAVPLADHLRPLSDVLIKVDVEGAELEVLRGCAEQLERPAVRAIYIDGFPDRDTDEILRLLASCGFTLLNAEGFAPFEPGDYGLFALRR